MIKDNPAYVEAVTKCKRFVRIENQIQDLAQDFNHDELLVDLPEDNTNLNLESLKEIIDKENVDKVEMY